MDMHNTSQLGSRNFFFLTTQGLIFSNNHSHGKCFGSQYGLKRFQKIFYLVVGIQEKL